MSEESQSSNGSQSSFSAKDLFVPIAIIVAGVFVGGGLYFSSAPSSAVPLVANDADPAVPSDNTAKVNPVTETDHIRGNLDAPIKIVEFSDYDCPFCSRFHDTMKDVVEKYGPENLAWVYRHFPLEQLHPAAPGVSLASECVADLGGEEAFWKFTDSYYEKRGSGDKTSHEILVPQLAVAAGVSESEFTECFESQRFAENVKEDIDNAVATGGRGTPWAILIGPSGKTYPINGAVTQGTIEQLITTALEGE